MSKWKVVAIIFILLFILETAFFIWTYMVGAEIIENGETCASEICNKEEYDSYYYNPTTSICYCYKDSEIRYNEYIE